MSILKKIFGLILVCLILLVLWQHDLVLYGLSQFKGQLKISWGAQTGVEFLEDPSVPESWKDKFRLLDDIRHFATDSLGLDETRNYTTVYNQHNEPVLWVLTGCRPFEFKAKTWTFPLLGEVSYKGFFNKKKGEEALHLLKTEGYDADLSATSGWSTLGWFNDPVLTNMLKKSEGSLAELIIHEITHATVFIKSNIDFNENLATFIGEQGALLFIRSRFGTNSKAFLDYNTYKSDETFYGAYMLQARERLDSLYHSFPSNWPVAQKTELKNKMILEIMHSIDSLPLINKKRYHFDAEHDSLPDNTYFMSNDRYRRQQEKIREVYSRQFKSNLKNFISFIRHTDQKTLLQLLAG